MSRDYAFTLRDKVAGALEGISNIGWVWDWSVFMKGIDDMHAMMKETISSVDQLRFWIIDLPQIQPQQIATMMQREAPTLRIYGYIGLSNKPGTAALSSGTATAATSTTLTDSTKTWSTNAYAAHTVWITGGTGEGQYRHVSSNTATALTGTRAWVTTPSTDSTYEIWPQPSELTLWGLAYDVIAALSADRSLSDQAVFSGLPQMVMEPVVFMGTWLCNRVTLTFERGRAQARSYT